MMNNSSLNGSDTRVGGSITIPSDMSTDATTKSMIRNGMKMTKPMMNPLFNCDSMNAGMSAAIEVFCTLGGTTDGLPDAEPPPVGVVTAVEFPAAEVVNGVKAGGVVNGVKTVGVNGVEAAPAGAVVGVETPPVGVVLGLEDPMAAVVSDSSLVPVCLSIQVFNGTSAA